MSLMNKLARKIVKAQQSPAAVMVNRPKPPTATEGRPAVAAVKTTAAPAAPAAVKTAAPPPKAGVMLSSYGQQVEAGQKEQTIAGLTTRGSRHAAPHAPGSGPSRPRKLRYGGRI